MNNKAKRQMSVKANAEKQEYIGLNKCRKKMLDSLRLFER
jgi:hypothetical protein